MPRTISLMQAEHTLRRARLLEGGAGNIGEWSDYLRIAGPVGEAWNALWAQPTMPAEPAKPLLPDKKGWPTELPKD